MKACVEVVREARRSSVDCSAAGGVARGRDAASGRTAEALSFSPIALRIGQGARLARIPDGGRRICCPNRLRNTNQTYNGVVLSIKKIHSDLMIVP